MRCPWWVLFSGWRWSGLLALPVSSHLWVWHGGVTTSGGGRDERSDQAQPGFAVDRVVRLVRVGVAGGGRVASRWGHALRIEDRLEDDRYLVRAEMPGIDPDKDVEITVSDGVLTIAAERREEVSEKGRSEFHYGSFVRRVSLPVGAVEDKLAARYQDGILEVSVPIEAAQAEPRTIPVARGSASPAMG